MARTIQEVEAEITALDTRHGELCAERTRLRGEERAASLSPDWRNLVAGAVIEGLAEEDWGGRVWVTLSPTVAVSVHVSINTPDEEEEDEYEGADADAGEEAA